MSSHATEQPFSDRVMALHSGPAFGAHTSVCKPQTIVSEADPRFRSRTQVSSRTNLTSVISDGAPSRIGGPQYPVPRLV